MADDMFSTPYLNAYMRMVEDTESPRLFHLWSAISALASSLGRRCWLPFGPMNIYPNHYILIVGTPGTRKSTAASMMKRILKDSTGVRFAPADTAGQRQGLVAAMQGNSEQQKEFINAVELSARDDSLLGLTLDDVANITNIPDSDEAAAVAGADKHHIVVVASEFSRFIGQNNIQMLDFLTTMWDGDDYEYQLKSSQTILKNPLVNMIGCTTPASIALSMPPAAGGQGFLSRMILVYGARKYKSVPRPQVPPLEYVDSVRGVLSDVYYQRNGPFEETDDARAFSESLYDKPLGITDSRFGYYAERRYTHLLKLAMCLCASRGSHVICKDDYIEADRILTATEIGMPDALGEFGLNPLATVKQSILDHIRKSAVIPLSVLQASFHRDARPREIMEVVNDLKNTNQIRLTQMPDGQLVVRAVYQKENTEDSIIKLLSER